MLSTPGDGPDATAPCQSDVGREVVPRPFRVVPGEDLGHEPPRDLDPLVDRERLAHARVLSFWSAVSAVQWRSSLAARGDRILECRSPSPSVVRPFGRCDGTEGAAIVPVMVTRQVEPRLLGRDREREVL